MFMIVARLAHAQTGINLAWNNCLTQASAAEDKAYACDGSMNGTPFRLVFSFFTVVAMPQFVGIEAIIDVRTSQATLPDWWRLAPGECRASNLGFPNGLTGIGTGSTGACQNPWAGATTGGGSFWTSDSVAAGVGRVRLIFARASETSLNANQQYVGGVVSIDSYQDIDSGDGVCAGCALPGCIVLNQVQLFQTIGATGGDIQTVTDGQVRSYVTWQGGSVPNGCPGTQAPQQVRWGSIRATLR
jgi:hypothetical protein